MKLTIVVRRIVFAIAFIIIAAYGYVALQGRQGIPALQEKRREIQRLEEDNANLEREIQYRRDRIKKLEENPAEQELEVRKSLKLLRPGETSFILPDRPQRNQTKPDQTRPDQAKPSDPPALPGAQ